MRNSDKIDKKKKQELRDKKTKEITELQFQPNDMRECDFFVKYMNYVGLGKSIEIARIYKYKLPNDAARVLNRVLRMSSRYDSFLMARLRHYHYVFEHEYISLKKISWVSACPQACFWLWAKIRLMPKYNSHKIYKLPANHKERLDCIVDYFDQLAISKRWDDRDNHRVLQRNTSIRAPNFKHWSYIKSIVEEYKQEWCDVYFDFEKLNWLKNNDEKGIDWAWEYLRGKRKNTKNNFIEDEKTLNLIPIIPFFSLKDKRLALLTVINSMKTDKDKFIKVLNKRYNQFINRQTPVNSFTISIKNFDDKKLKNLIQTLKKKNAVSLIKSLIDEKYKELHTEQENNPLDDINKSNTDLVFDRIDLGEIKDQDVGNLSKTDSKIVKCPLDESPLILNENNSLTLEKRTNVQKPRIKFGDEIALEKSKKMRDDINKSNENKSGESENNSSKPQITPKKTRTYVKINQNNTVDLAQPTVENQITSHPDFHIKKVNNNESE